jgi:hypothetical protein
MNGLRNLIYMSLFFMAQQFGTVSSFAAEAPEAGDQTTEAVGSLPWHDNYGHAVRQAIEERKMLVIYFFDAKGSSLCQKFEAQTLAGAKTQDYFRSYVLAKLPTDAEVVVNGKAIKLLSHPAFAEMLGKSGIAILDLTDKQSIHFHQVVSVLPFTADRYTSARAIAVLLTLPAGSLTQRTMVFAVRMHPEAPASTEGSPDSVLLSEADSHSNYQASIRLQGHHQWDARFHRINAKLPSGLMAQEVVAESWPNESLVVAAEDCVHSWRQSPGHWGAVRQRHPLFGFDIHRGRNGIWYATGIFGRR